MTYAEANAELLNVRAAIARVTGTTSSGGAQEYSAGGSRIVRASLETLMKRESMLAAMVKRLDPTCGGAVRQPIFDTRS